jgi:uncharacterized protein YndB with AHSA1/START domain
MLKFNESVHIQQPVQRVFSYTTDLSNNLQWQSDMLGAEQTSKGPFGLGATYRCVNRFMGQVIETEGVISEYDPEKKCSFKFTSGPVTGESSFFFESVADGTQFTTTGEVSIDLFRLADFFFRRMARKQIKKNLSKLKQVLENGNGQQKNLIDTD